MVNASHPTRRALLQAATGAAAVGTAGCTTMVTTPADASSRNEIQGNIRYIVGPSWLDEHEDNVVVLDARSRKVARRERIYGARHVPVEALTTREEGDNGLVPAAADLSDVFSEIGLDRDDDVLVYGESVGSRVTRVVFALEYLGHRGSIRVLNGGLDGWNGRIGTGRLNNTDPVDYEPEPANDLIVTRQWIADNADRFGEDSHDALIDVRSPEAYLGAEGSAALDSDHERHGHLPGAINVHWIGHVRGNRLQDPTQLARLYFAEANLEEESTVVTYGDENMDPTHTWVVLRALGFEDVRLYEGGFGEWANVPDHERGEYPVETKTNVVIETDGELGGGDSGDFSCTG